MAKKTGRCREVTLVVNWGHTLVAVAVEEKFKQVSMYGLSVGTKKKRLLYSRDVAVSGGSTVVKYHRWKRTSI